jgi:hypothetical protein
VVWKRCVLALVFALAAAGVAHADSAKRDVPDYDGRGNPEAEVHRRGSWIPRVLLWPIYALNEYVIRRPLGWVITHAEQQRWLEIAYGIVTFGMRDERLLVIPIVEFEWGFRTNVGVFVASDNVLLRGSSLRAEAATGGWSYWSAGISERYRIDDRSSVAVKLGFHRRADLTFYGIGPDVTDATRARYGLQQLDTHASYQYKPFGESRLVVSSGARWVHYRPGDPLYGDETLDQRIADGTLASPPGYPTPYTVLYARVDATLDSRAPRPAPGTGLFLRMHSRLDLDVANDRSWVEYGSEVGAAYDVTGHQRTLTLLGAVDFVEPIEGTTPFNELATLGPDLMPGFVGGWMIGRSTIAAQLAYTWPAAAPLDGELRVAIGNAFDSHLSGVAFDQLRGSFDFGLTSTDRRDSGFEVIFGLGTEPFGMGGHVTSVRLAIAGRTGF